jgi:predicted nucleic acid-binding protein
VADLLVAAAAEMWDLSVLHYDADFDHISTVTGQSCRGVVPAGTVS